MINKWRTKVSIISNPVTVDLSMQKGEAQQEYEEECLFVVRPPAPKTLEEVGFH